MSNRILIVGVVIAFLMFGGAIYVALLNSPDVVPAQSDDGAPAGAQIAAADPAKTPTAEGGTRTTGGTGAAEAKPEPEVKLPPMMQGWTRPAAVLLFSGEMHGYLEPCGCSVGQHGGLALRGGMIKQLKDKGWPQAGFDVGGLMSHTGRKQTQFKLESALRSLERLGVAAIGVGKEEVQMDPAWLVSIDVAKTPFVSANVVFFNENPTIQDALDAETALGRKPWKLVKIGDVKVAVTSIFGVRYQAEVLGNAGKTSEIAPVDPVAALKLLIPAMQAAKPDLMVLLSHASVEESTDFARKFPQFQIVATAGGPGDPALKPVYEGKTLIVMSGHKGRNVAAVGYYPRANPQFKFELVDLDPGRFEQLPSIREDLQLYQDAITEARLAETMTPINHPGKGNVDGTDLKFMGAAKCGECHTKAYSRLKNSKHMLAYESLIKGRPDEKKPIPRQNDPECISCHVTGWDVHETTPYLSGYLYEEMFPDRKGKPTKPDLKGNQCENCHGPGSKHVEVEMAYRKTNKGKSEVDSWRQFMHNDLVTAEVQICRKCHDGDNSPNFDFKKYWPQIAHPGRD